MLNNIKPEQENRSLRITLGKRGESLVGHYLEQKGFKVLAYNYKQKFGEVDIIAQKEEVIAFVEVKLRTNPLFSMSDLITKSKKDKIIKTAKYYIANNNFTDTIFRFDVAFVHECEINGQLDYEIEYLENAFAPYDI